MRLMGTIIAVLLAITMALFPISMAHAAALGAHGHATPVEVMHEDAAVADHDHAHGAHSNVDASCNPVMVGSSGENEPASHHGTTPACCGMSMCHAFQVSAGPLVSSPHAAIIPLSLAGDEQVDSTFPGRLDRPPRTV